MKPKHILTLIAWAMLVGLSLYTWHLSNKVRELESLEPVTYTDTVTVTDWQHDTVYQTDTRVETLRLVDTAYVNVNDTVYAQVEVPVYTYRYDTVFSSDSVTAHIRAVCGGFGVTLDTLSIQWEITHQEAGILPKKWYQHIAPAVGVGYGTSGWGFFVGLGYTL